MFPRISAARKAEMDAAVESARLGYIERAISALRTFTGPLRPGEVEQILAEVLDALGHWRPDWRGDNKPPEVAAAIESLDHERRAMLDEALAAVNYSEL
jgi:hypothetical protein